MTDEASREPARDPQDLERLLIALAVGGRCGAIDAWQGSNPGVLRGDHRNGPEI